MSPEEEKYFMKKMDEVYSVGFRNGQLEMQNKVMKSINRDWSLVPDFDVALKIMKKVKNIKLTKHKPVDNTQNTTQEGVV